VDNASCELAFTKELKGLLSPELKAAMENGVHSSYLQGNADLTDSIPIFRFVILLTRQRPSDLLYEYVFHQLSLNKINKVHTL